jgi:hypothetical protein
MHMSVPCIAVVDRHDPTKFAALIRLCSRRTKYVGAMATCAELTIPV